MVNSRPVSTEFSIDRLTAECRQRKLSRLPADHKYLVYYRLQYIQRVTETHEYRMSYIFYYICFIRHPVYFVDQYITRKGESFIINYNSRSAFTVFLWWQPTKNITVNRSRETLTIWSPWPWSILYTVHSWAGNLDKLLHRLDQSQYVATPLKSKYLLAGYHGRGSSKSKI